MNPRTSAPIFTFLLLVGALVATTSIGIAAETKLNGFLTRRGDQLFEGDKPSRFISVNIPNLQLIEDNFAPGAKTAWAWPNEFELNDALESVRQMGGAVVRTYVLSVRRAGSDMGEHVYVRGPGEFNEEAFRTLDLALEIANRTGVRLIIPLVDNAKWHGGRGEYAAFRGKNPDDFWTDQQIIADFEKTVRHVLTRVNTRTGVAYRDDPAIFGWETGNELDCPPEWTRRIAALLKELDPNHLVIDGRSMHGVPAESLDDRNVDVITTHHYPETGVDYVKAIVDAREQTRGKKAYFVGEFGFTPAEKMEQVYDAVIDNGVSGALIWSLRFHHRNGGFYWHFEPLGSRLYKAYHWPGFTSGEAYEERRVLELTRAKAFEIRGLEAPPQEAPSAPTLLAIEDVAAISWQGSAGARGYRVERAEDNDGPWEVVAESVDDTAVQYRPLFNDESVQIGSNYYYRVIAHSKGGPSPPSNVVGPVQVKFQTIVDEGRDLSKAKATPGVKPTTGDDRRRREDVHRLNIPAGESLTYGINQRIASWRAFFFSVEDGAAVKAAYSSDGKKFESGEVIVNEGPKDAGDYGYLQQLEISSARIPPESRYLRLAVKGGAVELSRIELRYGGR